MPLSRGSIETANAPRLRSACDACHQLKVRCSGGLTCEGCTESGNRCLYSIANRLAKSIRNTSTLKKPFMPHSVIEKGAVAGGAWQAERRQQQQRQQQQQHQRGSPKWQSPPSQPQNTVALKLTDGDTSMTNSKMADTVMGDGAEARKISWGHGVYNLSEFLGGPWGSSSSLTSSSKDLFSGGQILSGDQHSGQAESLSQDYLSKMGPVSSATIDSSTDFVVECLCFQRLTELLCSLKRSQLRESSPSSEGGRGGGVMLINRALLNIKEVLKACETLIECRDCAYNRDLEILLLPIMCTQAVVSQLQRVPWDTSGGLSMSKECEDGAVVGRAKESTSPESISTVSEEIQIMIGDFEVTGNDKVVLLRALRAIMLHKVEANLMSLKEILDRKKTLQALAHSPTHNAKNDGTLLMDHQLEASTLVQIEQMMQGLVHFVKVLQNA